MSVLVQGVQPRGNQVWAVRAAWGDLRQSLVLEQQRDGRVVTSWVVHQVPDQSGWALLWGDAPEAQLDLRTGDYLVVVGRQVGLGDAVAAVTQAFGVKPCGGCQKRKEWLNKKVPGLWRKRHGCSGCR